MKKFFILLFILLLTVSAHATTWYIDYVDGNDGWSGTSRETPWKTAPKDPGGAHNNVTISAGDTIIFKGGVTYRGRMYGKNSGTDWDTPITIKSGHLLDPAWGSGKAIIKGSLELTGTWTQCANASECWDNPNYEDIWYITMPAGATKWTRLYEDGGFCWQAQYPNPANFLAFNNTLWTYWRSIPSSSITSTTLVDPNYLTQSSSSYYNDALVAVWAGANSTFVRSITAFNPDTDTITFDNLGTSSFYNPTYYTILNHPAFIDQPGEYAVDVTNSKIFLYPKNESNPNFNSYEYSSLTQAFRFYNSGYLVFDSLDIRSFVTGITANDGGSYPPSPGPYKIFNCELSYFWGYDSSNYIVATVGNTTIDNVNVHDAFIARGIIIFGASNGQITNSEVSYIGYTGIAIYTASGLVVSGNYIHDILSVHGNGISVYSSSQNVVVEKNTIYNCNSMLTFEDTAGDITFRNNFINGGPAGGQVNDWVVGDGNQGTIAWLNNTVVNGGGSALRLDGKGDATYVVLNNIVDGSFGQSAWDIQGYNLYTSATGYNSQYATLETNLSNIFTDYAQGNWTPKAGGPARNTGDNLYATYGFQEDIIGIYRPQSTAWDIGAYEFNYSEDEFTPLPMTGVTLFGVRVY